MLMFSDYSFENVAFLFVISKTEGVNPDENSGDKLLFDWKYPENAVQVSQVGSIHVVLEYNKRHTYFT